MVWKVARLLSILPKQKRNNNKIERMNEWMHNFVLGGVRGGVQGRGGGEGGRGDCIKATSATPETLNIFDRVFPSSFSSSFSSSSSSSTRRDKSMRRPEIDFG